MALLSNNKSWPSILFLLNITLILCTYYGCALNLKVQNVSKSSIEAAFVFGDSTVDPGNNNNNIGTLFKSNFAPYGVDFPHHIPTGRFCNGRLPTDFLASYVGVKENIPAYLDPNLSLEDLTTGVSFASSGSGYDPLTAVKSGVTNMEKQLQQFDEYKIRVKSMIGKKRMKELLRKSFFIISSGTNDILFTFAFVDSPVQVFTPPTYLHYLLELATSFIQGLKDRGAEKIVVVGLPPIGCLPAVITLNQPFKPRKCVESLSSLAMDFNRLLQTQLTSIKVSQPTLTLIYADIYTPLQDQINHPTKYGFEEVNKGCCGSGVIGSAFLCTSLTDICSDRSKYIFWDMIHPTERSYSLLIEANRPLIDYVIGKLS